MKMKIMQGLAAVALLALSLSLAAAAPAVGAGPHPIAVPMTLADGIRLLPIAGERREGYQRTSFKHWTDADKDSCSTRSEVLIDESQVAPTVRAGCKVTAGQWYSYYGAT